MCIYIYISTRQVPRIVMIDVEEADDVKAQSLSKHHVLEVEIKKLLLCGVETKARKFKFHCHFINGTGRHFG